MDALLCIGQEDSLKEIGKGVVERNNNKLSYVSVLSIDEAMEQLFNPDQTVVGIIIQDIVDGIDQFISDMKNDDTLKYLPIIILYDGIDEKNRKDLLGKGINVLATGKFDNNEIILIVGNLVSQYTYLREVISDLSDAREKNITKAIQLEILKRFIPITVWETTANLAADQDFEIEEKNVDLAILFADLHSFTSISEKLSPKEVIELLNTLFTVVTKVIYDNEGDIDKFIGDAFLAVFENPKKCIISAISIQEKIAKINEKRASINLEPTNFRIGVHYGRVIRGSVGGNMRYDNTLIGDPINTTQRLESMSKPGDILASKEIISQIKDVDINNVQFIEYTLKGKNKKVEAIQLFDYFEKHSDLKNLLK